MKRLALFAVAGVVFTVPFLSAYEPTPEFERYFGEIEESIHRWEEGIRESAIDLMSDQYWGDAVRVFVHPNGVRDVHEGRDAIHEVEERMHRSLSREARREMARFALGEMELMTLPESPLPAIVFHNSFNANIFEYELRGRRVAIARHIVLFFLGEAFEADPFAGMLVDANGDGLVDEGEQVPLFDWFRSAASGPHRVENPLDEWFDWDENGRISEAESRRAAAFLYRDRIRFGADDAREIVDAFVNQDESPRVAYFEAADAYLVASGHLGELPAPVDDYTQRFDFDMDGFLSRFETEVVLTLLTRASTQMQVTPMFERDANDDPERLFAYLDTNRDGRLSEPELYDAGIIARETLTSTEFVTNPLEARFDLNDDYILSPHEREAARQVFLADVLPIALEHATPEVMRWEQMAALDANHDGRLNGEELDIVELAVLNPRGLIGKRPSGATERAIDVDPSDGRIQPHEIYMFVDGVFASLVQSWLRRSEHAERAVFDDEGAEDERWEAPTRTERDPGSGASRPDAVSGEQTTPSTEPATQSTESARDGLTLTVDLKPVFPVLFEYHANAPIGTVSLTNTGTTTLRDVSARLRTGQYMDIPLTGDIVPSVAPGSTATLPLRALFTAEILSITEGTRIAAEITVSYESELGSGERVMGEVLQIYDRNAVQWDDDRKVAAYVTSLSQGFMSMGNTLTRRIDGSELRSLSRTLQEGMLLFDALVTRGLVYRPDPSSAYADLSEDATAVDYVRYPYQTWVDRVGDCDDLSVLYCTLLESVGISSAFITVPGHIFTAFRLDIPIDRARTDFSDPSDLILTDDGEVWVPVETTKLDGRFVDAWQQGAKLYREHDGRSQASLIRTSDAWKVYDPVQSPFDEESLAAVDATQLDTAFAADLDEFVDREIADREILWKQQLADTSLAPAQRIRVRNRLGWLHACYGRPADARTEFLAILEQEEYAPALVNLGHLHFLDGEYRTAAGYYDRALAARQSYVPALLGSSRAHYELENYGNVRTSYEALQSANPTLAATYGYLNLRGTGTTRAQAAQGLQNRVEWALEAP